MKIRIVNKSKHKSDYSAEQSAGVNKRANIE